MFQMIINPAALFFFPHTSDYGVEIFLKCGDEWLDIFVEMYSILTLSRPEFETLAQIRGGMRPSPLPPS